MAVSKLISLLQKLNKPQLQRLHQFVHSPYFNTDKNVAALFDSYKKQYPEINEATGEKIIANKNKLAKTKTQLLHLAGQFIAHEITHNDYSQKLLTLKAYKQLHLEKHYQYYLKRATEELRQQPFKDCEHHWHQHLLTEIRHEGYLAKQDRTAANNITPVLATLDLFYLTKKLRYVVEALNRQLLLNIPFDERHLQHLPQSIAPFNSPQHPYIYIYAHILHFFIATTEATAATHYHTLIGYLPKIKNDIHPTELNEIYGYCINHCIRWLNGGHEQYLAQYFKITQWRYRENLLLDGGSISPHIFRNIVTTALKLNETQWAWQFINEYTHHLKADCREDYTAFALGAYYYKTKDYNQALVHLNKAGKNKDISYAVVVRKMAIKCGYESNAHNNGYLPDMINALEKYVLRKQALLGSHIPLIKPFIKYTKLLLATPRAEHAKLQQEIQQHPPFPDKDWLEAQLSVK